jgi:hypothetical protein
MAILDHLPPPLVDDFLRGRWLPIVGTGFSRNAKSSSGSLPDWRGLGEALAADLNEFVPRDAIDAISAYEEQYDWTRLIDRMGELLRIDDAQPGPAHEAFCRAGFDLVITTNFDFLLERAYESIGQPCQPLLTESQLPQRPFPGQAQLLKLHGDLNHPDELVATEDDFDGFLQRYPLKATFLGNLLITRSLVLVGYSFDDADARSLWTVIRNRLGSLQRRGYVFLLDPTPTERARFARRNITPVTLPGADYGEAFAELFEELRAHFNSEVGRVSQPVEDEVAAQLVLPATTTSPSRLCFCSVPVRLLAWYRSEVFPAIEAAGYVTVTRDEVLVPGGNAVATVNALLARSAFALIDASSFSTGYELTSALAVLPPERVIVIFDRSQPVSPVLRGPLLHVDVPLILRDEDPTVAADSLVTQIRNRLAQSAPPAWQPQTLLNQGHPNAAVVAAFGLLEEALTERAAAVTPERPAGPMQLIRWAHATDILSDQEYKRFQQWVGLRNRAVHTTEPIDPDAAREALRDIETLLARLRRDRNA